MELERYEALLCAIELGSLTAAAEKLGYTPSGISRMMAALEEENGFPLLRRGREGVVPTQDCEQMLPAIRELLFRGERCRQLAARIRGLEVGTVVIGTAYTAYYGWLSQVASAFHKTYPGIQVQMRGGYSSQLLELMEQRQLDLCIISRREGEYHWLPLCRDEMVAWIPAEHPLARGRAVPMEVFAREPYIETYHKADIDSARAFVRQGVQPNVCFTTMDTFATYSMVEAGLGLSMTNALNSASWQGNVKILPLEPPQQVEIGVACDKSASPAARRFFDFMQNNLPE